MSEINMSIKNYYKKEQNEFLNDWLLGTTCWRESNRHIAWASPDGRFILAKHSGHTTHIVRSDYGYCEMFYELHDLKKVTYFRGLTKTIGIYKTIERWEGGRWNKKRQKEMENLIKCQK